MSVGAITAGEAYVSVTCDNSELVAGLRESSATIAATAQRIAAAEDSLTPRVGIEGVDALERALGRVERAVGRVRAEIAGAAASAAASAAEVFHWFRSGLANASNALGEYGDSFDKMSERTGVSAAALSEYGYAASKIGAEISNVEGALKGMASYLDDAANGGGDALATFERLGLSVAELSAASPEEQFDAISRAVAGIVDPTTRAALAMKIFGDDGQLLLPLFAEGPNGLRKMRDEARELGVSLSGEAAAGAAAYVDATKRLKTSLQGVSLAVANLFAPAITNVANAVSDLIAKLTKWTNEHPKLATAATIAAGAISGIGAGALAVNATIPLLTAGFHRVVATLALINAHPIIAASAAVVALTGAVVAYYAARSSAAANAPKWSDEAADALEAGNALRSQDEARLNRLEELRQKEELTTNEIAEAVEIVAELNSRYGDVGVSVDALTGKINIAADAQRRLNALQLQAKIAETDAALEEAKLNAEPGVIERKIADEEVGFAETAIGKKRGESWGDYFSSLEWYDDPADLKVAIAEGDPRFQKRVAAARKTNDAKIASLEAQSQALAVALEAPGSNAAPSSSGTAGSAAASPGGESLDARLADYAADAEKIDLSPLDRKIAEIEERGEKLKDAVRKAFAPDLDWMNADAVWRFLNDNPAAFAAIDAKFNEIDASTAKLAQAERDAAAQKAATDAENERRKAEEESRRDAEKAANEANAAQTKIDAFEKRRADEGKTAIERKIDAIRSETAAYVEQLKTLKALEEAKGTAADAGKIAELDRKINDAEADGAARQKSALQDSRRAYWEKFADPFEKYAVAQQELAQALKELRDAQAGGDETVVAAALEKLGIAREKFDSAESAAESAASAAASATESTVSAISERIETGSVGSFSAYQAAAIASGYDKKLFEQSKRQTQILQSIERKTGVARFA